MPEAGVEGPSRAKLLKKSGKPMCTRSDTNITGSSREKPEADGACPIRTGNRVGKEEPKAIKSKTKDDGPNRTAP